jgi:MFS family permease
MIGLSLGAEVDILAYLTSRYFGLKAFGTIYGMFFAAVLFGTAFGPVSFGLAFERTGTYVDILVVCVLLNVIALGVTAFLRPYPDWEKAPVKP